MSNAKSISALVFLLTGLDKSIKNDKASKKKKGKGKSAASKEEVEPEIANEEYNHSQCSNCSDGGDLLCCDACPLSFHLKCLDPPLTSIPEGEWKCPNCRDTPAPDYVQ